VTRWSKLDNVWEGVPIGEIVSRAKPRPEATFVMQHADPDYTTNIALSDLVQDDCCWPSSITVVTSSRTTAARCAWWCKALLLEERQVAPRLEFLDVNPPGFWEQNGYHMHADRGRKERYSDQEIARHASRCARRPRGSSETADHGPAPWATRPRPVRAKAANAG